MSAVHRWFVPRALVLASTVPVAVAMMAACASSPAKPAAGGSSSTSGSSVVSPTTPTSSSPPAGGTAIDGTYYAVAVGNTWVYRIDAGPRGPGVITDTEKIIRVEPVTGGHKVTISRALRSTKGLHSDLVTTESVLFHTDGSVTLPYENSVAAPGATVTVTAGHLVYPTPAALAAGTTSTGQVKILARVGGRNLKATVDLSLKGAGTATVTVPAGTYRSTRILAQTAVEHGPGSVSIGTVHTRTYLAPGVGIVKTTVDGLPGGTGVSSVLVSFTHG